MLSHARTLTHATAPVLGAVSTAVQRVEARHGHAIGALTETLAEHPQIEELLKPVFESLTLETLQELNGKVQVDGLPAADVAQEYLTANGLLK